MPRPEERTVLTPRPRFEASQTRIAAALLLVLGLSVWLRQPAVRPADAPLPPLQSTLDPNVAPWWELTAIPEIGETLARRIVEHREKIRREGGVAAGQPVYRTAVDLDEVRGIGPVTVRRIGPYLRFGDR